MKRLAPTMLALLLLLSAPAAAQGPLPAEVDLSYYLPEAASYDPEVPAPAEVLGHQVGAWHVRPDQLVGYMERLAAASDRVRIEELGRTHERRPQVLLTISSPENLARLDEIGARHRELSEGRGPGAEGAGHADLAGRPVFVYLGYSIHGNEPSGANASMLVAYHLAAGRGGEVEEMLANAVVLLDPSLNPDGLGRFAHWANMYRGEQPVADPDHREHVEAWPSGRTNHYWFDLNRDWLLLQHPESRNRVAAFQRYRPNVLADFHEMGTSATYFFQPGVPSRQNPLTPHRNLELTREIARFHAEALDEAGSLYYSEETFDDFYFGKGSTYPDIQGAVGILFEQASARGHVQEKGAGQGRISFPFAIRNQFLTSLSTLRAAVAKRDELLSYQAGFYRDALAEAARAPVGAHLVGSRGDRARLDEMVAVLRAHGIRVHRLGRTVTRGGVTYAPGDSVAVPTGQRQYRLLEALFERRTEFADTTFYDVSAWTLPLAFGLPSADLARGDLSQGLLGEEIREGGLGAEPGSGMPAAADPVAWAFEWTSFYAPRALYRLLADGVQARVATRTFEAEVAAEGGTARRAFGYGTVVVPLGLQPERAAEIRETLAAAEREDGIGVHALTTGLTGGGMDLGSPSLEPLEAPVPLLLIGNGVSSYAAGEVWHHLDHRLGLEVTLADRSYLDRVDLSRYTHLILAHGGWGGLSEDEVAEIGSWVRAGGTLVALQGAAVWAEGALLGIEAEPAAEEEEAAAPLEPRPYARFRQDVAVPLVAGTIFEAHVDETHPLAYGYAPGTLPVFRDTTLTLTPSENPYDTPVRYTERPLLAGYVSPQNLERLGGTPAVIATRLGRGVVIRMVDDPVFRGVWFGTAKLLSNAIFFGPVIDPTEVPEGVRPR
ncbi:MAG TPA: M14 metallopeptidase family protein [Thermoanaerobaculia bacterium]|nr:M14 metallopeptidase family protein [Thermoanaerobaculia bacterium]